jgi:hypothetical protein
MIAFNESVRPKKDRIHALSDNNRVIDLKKPEPFLWSYPLYFYANIPENDSRLSSDVELL